MSKTIRSPFASAAMMTLAWCCWSALAPAAEPIGAPAADPAQMETFSKPGGDTYFALKLTPPMARPAARPHDIVVLFDTSASQTGAYRDKAIASLQALLGGMDASDRVALLAVDLNAVRLTKSFVPAGSPEMQQALAALEQRVPLGSTDMLAGLTEAAVASNE